MLVVFDLDGTLIDSRRSLLEAHEIAWSSLGLVRPADSAILKLVGLPLIDTMRILGPHQNPETLAELYSQAYATTAMKYERLFDGVSDLFKRPFRAAVATGKSQRGAERAVTQHGFASRFEVVLGGNSVRHPKPHPDLLHAIIERTGTRDLVMVGDTTYDLEMAAAAGVRAIGVSWGHHPVERLKHWAPIAKSVAELGGLLGVM